MAAVPSTFTTSIPATAGSVTLNKPSGAVTGDLLIASITYDDGAGVRTITSPPAGWNQVHVENNNQANIYVYEKICGASEPASWTWTLSGNADVSGIAFKITGHAGIGYIGSVSGGGGQVTNDDSPSWTPGITPTYANSLLLMLVFSRTNGFLSHSDYAIVTDNPTWTKLAEALGITPHDSTASVAYAQRPQVTGTGAYSAITGTGAATDSVAVLLQIVPRIDVVATTTHLSVDGEFPTPTGGSAGVVATASHLSVAPELYPPQRAKATNRVWTEEESDEVVWIEEES